MAYFHRERNTKMFFLKKESYKRNSKINARKHGNYESNLRWNYNNILYKKKVLRTRHKTIKVLKPLNHR